VLDSSNADAADGYTAGTALMFWMFRKRKLGTLGPTRDERTEISYSVRFLSYPIATSNSKV
jgi:hypothetical protein